MSRRWEKRLVSSMFDIALSTIADEAYRPSTDAKSFGYEFAHVDVEGRYIRHIRPIGGGYPQMAFILTAGGIFAVVKEDRDAEWQSAAPAQPTSRDVGPHGAGANAPASLKRN